MAGDSIDVVHEAAPTSPPEPARPSGLAMTSGKRNTARSAGFVVAAVAAFVVLGFFLFHSTGQDDSYISYWPAYTLARFGRIINYNGSALEQSSSLLWVLLLGGIAFLTRAPVPLLGPLLSIASGALTIVLSARLAARLDRRVSKIAVLLIATATYLIYWSFSGMETSLVAVCTVWLAMAYSDYLAGTSKRKLEVLAATLCCVLVRPEMGFVLGAFLVLLCCALWARRSKWLLDPHYYALLLTRASFLGLMIFGATAGIAIIRLGYFHSLLPEPAQVKGGLHPHLRDGVQYLLRWSFQLFVLPSICLMVAGTFWTLKETVEARALNLTRLVCALLLISYVAFIVWVGGDWMLAGRFIVHVLPIGLFLAAYALGRITPAKMLKPAAIALVAIQIVGSAWYARTTSVGAWPGSTAGHVDPQTVARLSWFERTDRLFLRDAPVADAVDRVVTRMLTKEHPLVHIFSGQMGIVLFKVVSHHPNHIDVTDRHGLADNRLASCALAKGQPRLSNGLAVDYGWFLLHQKALKASCDIPSPDIIYDIEHPQSMSRARLVQRSGYALVYHQICDVPRSRGLLPGDRIPVGEYIAVRRDLLPALGLHEVQGDQLSDATL
jgi:hypothetical protein